MCVHCGWEICTACQELRFSDVDSIQAGSLIYDTYITELGTCSILAFRETVRTTFWMTSVLYRDFALVK